MKASQSSESGEMAQTTVDLPRESFSCPICLDLLTDPVTLPCGHNYCMTCINGSWDREADKNVYRCPQCSQTFTPRPPLQKNTLIAELVEALNKTRPLAATAAAVCSYAGPDDVCCDSCTGRKMRALKSCQVCLVSFCQQHLQPHLRESAFKRHKLVNPVRQLEENICTSHREVMKIFCRTDRQVICYLCAVDGHKDHDTVSAAAARGEQEKEAEQSRGRTQQSIRKTEKELRQLQQEEKRISVSAERAEKDSDEIFTQMTTLFQRRRSEVEQQIKSQREADVSQVQMLQEELRKEITELRRKDAELEKLLQTEDHTNFLQKFASLSEVGVSSTVSRADVCPHNYSRNVAAALLACRDQLQDVLRDRWTSMSLTPEEHLLLEAEPQTRAEFLSYSRDITLNPNTAHTCLQLSEGNRKVKGVSKKHLRPHHPDRFTDEWQVLSRETLTGRGYWEVKWTVGVSVAVVLKSSSTEEHQEFGFNDKSWSLCWSTHSGCEFVHDSVTHEVSVRPSSRMGVYLDHSAGLLSFYSATDTMTLLHRVQTTFTEPLHVGIAVGVRSSCEFVKLN
ncbi:tripartite motif-containing protein 16-like [Synchiropus picturatus]